ncbi:MAG: glycosyltransferase family 4 protein [Chloroflexota bacterium]|nr:glycosyltransferase family 4 protein [Chloroflexota bacterium]
MTPDPLRIAMYTSSLAQPGRKPGGVDILINRLANTLTQRGHDVTIWSYSPPPTGALYGHVQLLPKSTATRQLARVLVAPARLNRVEFGDAQIVHLHGDDWFFFRRRLPTIRTLYGSALYEMRYATRARRMLSQAALVPLEALACLLATDAYGMIPGDGPVHRLRGHLPGAAAPDAGQPCERSARPSVLFVGTWKGRKRGSLLRDEFVRHVLPVHPDAELWCVSDFCEESESVRWIQTPTDDELEQLYRRAWVFCLPSRYEGFGLPYVEAMARGVPVVATPNPGACFLTREGRDGLLVPDATLGRTLAGLLSDAERRATLADAGRRRANDFTCERSAERHEAAYRSTIERFGGRSA